MKIQMKLKYTLVFTIISFFISTAGFAQQYTDEEIGLNVSKITASLKEKGVAEADIEFEISLLRKMHTNQYAKIKQNENEILKETKAKALTNKSALAADISSTEKAALQALYNSTNGANWINKQGWDFSTPVTSWDGTNGWYGITVTNGTITSINLGQNNLTGTLASEIGSLTNLQQLYLQDNELSGAIPNEIGNLLSLKILYLNDNKLAGSIPTQMGNLVNLSQFALSFNKLSGSIPSSLGNLNNVEFFFIGNNELTGSIPPEIGNLSKVTHLYLYHNQLSGSIPTQIGNLSKVQALFLEYNNLSGSIPNEISNLSSLKFFNLSNNQLTGPIPTGIGNLYYNLLEVYFRNNQLSGPLTNDILLYNLVSLYLDNNQLSGPIPSSINRLRNIGLLYLDHNQFTGTIPANIGNLPEAIHVNLSNNQLTGTIPPELGGLSKVQMLDLSFNQLTGSIPLEIGNLTSIRNLFLNNNEFSGTIPSRLTQLTLIGNFYINNNKFRFIDFANEYQTYKNFYGFKYVDQAKTDTKETKNFDIGSSTTLTMCTDNRYTINDTFQWYKGKFPDGGLINGATNREYTISNLSPSDAGDYYCLSSHPQITIATNPDRNLVLEREPITLKIACATEVTGASIMPSNNSFTTDTNIEFYLDSTYPNLTYNWTFYNLDNTPNETYEGNYILKSFDTPGTYRMNLVVMQENGCTTSFDKYITVKYANPCLSSETGSIIVKGFDYDYNNLPNNVFSNTSTYFSFDAMSRNLSYNWKFYNPDGTFLTSKPYQSFDIIFENNGEHKVVLEITDLYGCTATFEKIIPVIKDCRKTGVILTYEGSSLDEILENTSLSVKLFGNDFDLDGKQFNWEFLSPNGSIVSTGSNPVFTVTPPTVGNYRINLKITDPESDCIYDFSVVLEAVDACRMTHLTRNGYISLNGQSEYLNDVLFLDLNQTVELGLFREWYNETGKTFNLEWNFYSPNSELISTGNQPRFPITLTTEGFYKVTLKVTDPETGCFTEVSRKFSSVKQNSCTLTNERSNQVKDLTRALIKKLILRTVTGETDAQINASPFLEEFTSLKPFIINSPNDKIYNYKTTRNKFGILINVDFSFSPERESDVHISVRDGLFTNFQRDYVYKNIDDAVYIDINQYVTTDETLLSCWTYAKDRSLAKSALEQKDCRYSSEIKNINFCPNPCTPIVGTMKTSSNDFFTNRKTVFSLETLSTDLTYKWTFYNSDNTSFTNFTTSNVDYLYRTAGNYNVVLEVTDSKGCSATFEKTIVVSVNTNCVSLPGTILTSTPEVYVSKNTTFSFETPATDLTYKWIFTQNKTNESTVFFSKTVDFTYLLPGSSEIRLEVTDSNGCKSIFQKSVTIKQSTSLCDNVIQFGRSYIQVGTDSDLFKSATISVNQTTNITFSSQNYSPQYDLEYKWSLLNEDDQVVDSGNNLNFPITPVKGGYYKAVLDLKDHTSGCVYQLVRSIVCTIPSSCTGTNPQSTVVKGLVINLLKNLISRSMMGESDADINSSAVPTEFNTLKPYITTNTAKNRIYNFATTRSTANEFTSVSFSFSPERASDIYISIPHSLQYSQGMPLDYLLSMIESKIYIDLSQYASSNQYLISCLSDSQASAKSVLHTGDCLRASEIRYIDFCPNECDPLLGVIKTNSEIVSLNTPAVFSLETNNASVLSYNWTFYNPDNSVRENQTTSNAFQTYTIPGTYKVELEAKDVNNCTTTLTKMITVAAPACVAAIGTIKTVSPNIFTGTNTEFLFETTATNLTYEWTLYRNVNSSITIFTTNTANIYYLDPGNYNVKLIVTDANGCKNTFRTTVTATVKPPCVNVVGEIKTANPIISTNENTTFSFETTATILRYYWTFHSLNNTPLLTTTESSPTLMYTYPNSYKVTLTVWDENDCYTIIEKNINVVRGCPVIPGSANIPETAATGQIIPFEYNTTSNGVGYKWTFYNLDGSIKSTATTNKVNKAYYAAGDYRVTLELSDLFNNGCNTFIDKIVKVTGECNISGTIESNPADGGITLDQYVYFRFESEAIDVKYKWTVTTPDNVSTLYSTDKYAPYYFQSGSGLYKIAVEVSDGYGCVLNLEKTYNLEYDCSRNTGLITGSIYNNNHKFYYSSDVLIDAPNKFTFWHNNSSNENLPVSWELTDLNGALISSGTEKEFIFTPTTSAGLILKLTITDQYGCPHHFSKELNVVEKCQFYVSDISGDINFDEEYSYKVAFIDANQTKDLILRSYDENDGKVYTYQWNLYDLDGALVSTGSQQKFPITLSNAGFYKVTLDIIDPDTDCPIQFTKKIGCVINNSCTENNPKSQIVKDLFLNLIRSLIIRGSIGETDEQINNSEASPEFIALKPYITNGPKDKIYNFKSKFGGENGNSFEGFDFSFSPDRQSDVHYYTRWSPYFDPWDIENSIERINQTLYFTLNQYVSADQSLVSCYVDYGGKMAGKNVNRLDEEDCTHQLAVQYIDFCPAEDCTPITGTLKSTTVLGVQTGDKKILLKPASRK